VSVFNPTSLLLPLYKGCAGFMRKIIMREMVLRRKTSKGYTSGKLNKLYFPYFASYVRLRKIPFENDPSAQPG